MDSNELEARLYQLELRLEPLWKTDRFYLVTILRLARNNHASPEFKAEIANAIERELGDSSEEWPEVLEVQERGGAS